MNKKVKEPFLATRVINMILGFVILALVLLVIYKDGGTEIYEMMIFALAAVENFIVATVSFSEHKKVRGNIYAVICAIFFIIAIILAVRFLEIL